MICQCVIVPIAGDGDLRTLTLILVPPQIPLPRSRPPHPLSPSPSNRPPSPASPWPSFTATAPLLPPHTLPSPPHPHNPSPSPFPHPHGPAEEDHSHLQLHPLVSISRPHQLSLLQIHKPLPQPQLLHLGRRQLLLRGDLTPVVITTRTRVEVKRSMRTRRSSRRGICEGLFYCPYRPLCFLYPPRSLNKKKKLIKNSDKM